MSTDIPKPRSRITAGVILLILSAIVVSLVVDNILQRAVNARSAERGYFIGTYGEYSYFLTPGEVYYSKDCNYPQLNRADPIAVRLDRDTCEVYLLMDKPGSTHVSKR